jgi:hypothetical protein
MVKDMVRAISDPIRSVYIPSLVASARVSVMGFHNPLYIKIYYSLSVTECMLN